MLLLVAIVLAVILFPFGIVFTVFEIFRKKCFWKAVWYLSNTIRQIAISIDQLGNVVCRDLFNLVLIDKRWYERWYRFWHEDETISSVLGRNKRANTLTKSGKILADILDFFDDNHCIKSIEDFKSKK